MLRCVELGISISDLEQITIGMVMDMLEEKYQDSQPVEYEASQQDFDSF